MKEYIYLGDRYTDEPLKKARCVAVQAGGKCICGKTGTMLVQFEGGRVANVLRKLLRTIKPDDALPETKTKRGNKRTTKPAAAGAPAPAQTQTLPESD